MAESTSNYDFYDLMLRVAEAAGVAYYGNDGSERAAIPIDAHDLDKCRRAVNDGIKMFIADAPENGWRWMNRIMQVTFATVETTGTVDSGNATTLVDATLATTYTTNDQIKNYYVYDKTQEIYAKITGYTAATGTITVSAWLDYDDNTSSLTPTASDSFSITNLQTVNGEKTRYPLSQDFMGDFSGKITYAADSNRGHIINWCHPNLVRTKWESVVSDSHPTHAAVRPWRNRRWELIVDPSPTSGDTVEFPYRVGFDKLQIEAGIATAADSTSITIGGLANFYPDDYFNNWVGHIMAGTGRSSYATITDYTGSTGKFTVADWLKSTGAAGGIDPVANSSAYFEPNSNKHPAGMQFDEVVVSACLAKAETLFEGLQLDYSPMEKYLQKDLPAAYRVDARSAPKRLGKMLSGSRRINVF
ncbi:MAG: hypothetical protein GWN67_20510, partial [Phycisphaerae bacterium]|nr:hypothetical protein [Fodinibius sp.]NIU58678.1 hypothetical protein [Phycisphaerae bacterium]NIV16167.1 hypothetical protein [Fodinibius sp.]NIW94964.1 hypothetical protein [Phycisphaerae bacterium]NIY30148.1 hypothetical protein [Fodinibius sp.]